MKMKKILSPMVRGLIIVGPIVGTISLLIWLLNVFDAVFGGWLNALLGSDRLVRMLGRNFYVPGMGVVMGLLLVFVVGVFFDYWMVKGLVNWAEDLLARLPLVKSIYGSLRDLAGFFSADSNKRARQVVVVKMGGGNIRFLGLMTREDLNELPKGVGGEDMVAVYVPLSYAMGGITTIVPRSAIEPVNMSIEEAMRFAITAGMSAGSTPGSGKTMTDNTREPPHASPQQQSAHGR